MNGVTMPPQTEENEPIWAELAANARRMELPACHLKNLMETPDRLGEFSRTGAGMLLDFSRQRMDRKILALLLSLADLKRSKRHFARMMAGEPVNTTERRAALHTATRSFSGDPLYVDGTDVMPDITRERDRIRQFSVDMRKQRIIGSTGKPLQHIVVVGIGGSYLGTQFVYNAVRDVAGNPLQLHFLSNVDIHEFADVTARIDPEATLWIIISKSYTTSETLANETQARAYMVGRGLDPAKHFVAVTGEGSPGDDPENPVLATFRMFDFIGGRFSVTSAVGGVPLSIAYGYETFERFLGGAEEMDQHALEAQADSNLPLIAALISYWNHRFLGYRSQAIVPYASPLSKLAPHIQQLHMESNGKSVSADGQRLPEPAGFITFGEPGTNAQHSFFQLAHQSQAFPIDFIGVVKPSYDAQQSPSQGITNHQELWSNMISQASALARGRHDDNPAVHFPGNRPSSTILISDLSAKNIGRLLAFYEAKTVFEAFLWGNNPFDQFGVELGKTMAASTREEIAQRNKQNGHRSDSLDPIISAYLNILFEGKLPD